VAQNIGDADKAMASATTKIEAIYQVPFLAHATMEPMNCTVHFRKDACEIWIGSQAMARVQAMAAKAAGLPPEKVIVHNHLIGGGFGRRLEADGAIRAVEKVRLRLCGPVRRISSTTCTGPIGSIGCLPVSTRKGCRSLGTIASRAPLSRRDGSRQCSRTVLTPTPPKARSISSTTFPTCTSSMCGSPGIPTAFWRSVGPSHNVFVTESFIDELAATAKQDPVAYRRALLDKSPRERSVRWILGNPLIAITMLRHDITAGLFAPVEILVTEKEGEAGTTVTYVRPSSLMVTEENLPLHKAAKALDGWTL
jgi:isoquinoline 1-oxidoreductase subunit beta